MSARVWVAWALAASLPAFACETPTTTAPPPPPNRTPPVASASASHLPPELKGPEYTENDFVESDHNRDPFRSFVVQSTPGANRIVPNQRKVELPEYSIDELKLVGIVLGSQPSAMFVDPTGKGVIVYKGTFVCRPEVVHIGGSNGPEYQLNWRVNRIRQGEVVLIREDPAQPAIPPAERSIPLHPENDKQPGTVPG